MANRGIRELLRLALVDYRFYLGTIADYSGNGNDGAWIAGRMPEFKRTIGGVVGLEFGGTGAAGTAIVTSADVDISGAFAWEVVFLARSPGETGAARIVEHDGGGDKIIYTTGAITVTFSCGAFLNLATYNTMQVYHLVCSRDDSDDGDQLVDSYSRATGAVGGNDGSSPLYIGNRSSFNRAFDGIIYSVRSFDDAIDPDEAARLYEHSRIQLWPGAPKRSGIMSPVE